mmetsp:Transcript_64158/g.186028  ORF Transcript_64158/g.186028 Transcript_64158/m.186028 type:complete len:510 (+) Transcript_64158:1470-2999(+)
MPNVLAFSNAASSVALSAPSWKLRSSSRIRCFGASSTSTPSARAISTWSASRALPCSTARRSSSTLRLFSAQISAASACARASAVRSTSLWAAISASGKLTSRAAIMAARSSLRSQQVPAGGAAARARRSRMPCQAISSARTARWRFNCTSGMPMRSAAAKALRSCTTSLLDSVTDRRSRTRTSRRSASMRCSAGARSSLETSAAWAFCKAPSSKRNSRRSVGTVGAAEAAVCTEASWRVSRRAYSAASLAASFHAASSAAAASSAGAAPSSSASDVGIDGASLAPDNRQVPAAVVGVPSGSPGPGPMSTCPDEVTNVTQPTRPMAKMRARPSERAPSSRRTIVLPASSSTKISDARDSSARRSMRERVTCSRPTSRPRRRTNGTPALVAKETHPWPSPTATRARKSCRPASAVAAGSSSSVSAVPGGRLRRWSESSDSPPRKVVSRVVSSFAPTSRARASEGPTCCMAQPFSGDGAMSKPVRLLPNIVGNIESGQSASRSEARHRRRS